MQQMFLSSVIDIKAILQHLSLFWAWSSCEVPISCGNNVYMYVAVHLVHDMLYLPLLINKAYFSNICVLFKQTC